MAKPNAESTFRAKAPGIMAQLIPDFPITPDDAAAILGNLGHESAGLTTLQEIKPTVAGNSLALISASFVRLWSAAPGRQGRRQMVTIWQCGGLRFSL